MIPLLSLCFFHLLHLSTGLTLPARALPWPHVDFPGSCFHTAAWLGIFVGVALSGHIHSPLQEVLPFLSVKQISVTVLAESFSWKLFFCKNGFSPQITSLLHVCFFFCENWSWLFSCIPISFSLQRCRRLSAALLLCTFLTFHLLSSKPPAFSYLFYSPLTLSLKVPGHFSLLPHSGSKWSILLAFFCS